eukprot:symbB.v1.2.033668.t1/scaffold4165.1/size44765/3
MTPLPSSKVSGSPMLSTTPVDLELPVKLLRLIHSPAQSMQYEDEEKSECDSQQDKQDEQAATEALSPGLDEKTKRRLQQGQELDLGLPILGLQQNPASKERGEYRECRDSQEQDEQAPTNDWKLPPSVGTWCMIKIAEEAEEPKKQASSLPGLFGDEDPAPVAKTVPGPLTQASAGKSGLPFAEDEPVPKSAPEKAVPEQGSKNIPAAASLLNEKPVGLFGDKPASSLLDLFGDERPAWLTHL